MKARLNLVAAFAHCLTHPAGDLSCFVRRHLMLTVRGADVRPVIFAVSVFAAKKPITDVRPWVLHAWHGLEVACSLCARPHGRVERNRKPRWGLVAHIDSFIADYNQSARPFIWTKSAVHQKRLKPCFAI